MKGKYSNPPSREDYQTYIESQLTKFAAFMAESPLNHRRVEKLEEMICSQETKIMDLQSKLKLISIYHNDNMNEMYKRGQSLDLLGIDERIEECLNKRNLGDVEAVQTEIFEEINNIKHTLSHRQHKTEKQHTKVTTEERGSWEQIKDGLQEWCQERVLQSVGEALRVQNYVKKKELAEYKLEMKNYFVEKFEKFYKLVRSSTSQKRLASHSVDLKEVKVGKVVRTTETTTVHSPLKPKVTGQLKKPSSSTVKAGDFNLTERSVVPKIKRFSVEEVGNEIKKSKKREESLSVSGISNQSHLSRFNKKSQKAEQMKGDWVDKGNKGEKRDKRERVNKSERTDKVEKVGRKEKKERPEKQQNLNKRAKKSQQKMNRTSQNNTPSISISRHRSVSQSVGKVAQKKSQRGHSSCSKSPAISCSRSHSKSPHLRSPLSKSNTSKSPHKPNDRKKNLKSTKIVRNTKTHREYNDLKKLLQSKQQKAVGKSKKAGDDSRTRH